MSEKLVMFHGFEQEEVLEFVRLIKAGFQKPREVAFCMTTETNLEWKIKDLIADVTEEHQYMMRMEDQRAAERKKQE